MSTHFGGVNEMGTRSAPTPGGGLNNPSTPCVGMSPTHGPTPITLDTDCPPWCTEHDWWGEVGVLHRAPVALEFPPPDPHSMPRRFTVSPEKCVLMDGTSDDEVHVKGEATQLLTAAEVGQLVAALIRAAGRVFPDDVAGLAHGMFGRRG